MPLASGSAASQIDQPTGRAPQKAAKASVGLPRGRDRRLAVPDHGLGQGAELGQAAAHPPEDVGGLLGEDQRAGAGARVAQGAGDHPAAAGLAVADRDLGPRLPEVELADLPGSVDGALVGAPGGKARAHLAQVVVEDRLAALIAELGDQLADAGARDPGSAAQQSLDLLPEGIELGGPSASRS